MHDIWEWSVMDHTVKKDRIQIIDGIRGLSILLMVVHHFLYDLTEVCNAPEWIFTNPLFDSLHYFFAGLFILLSGVSSLYSSSNVKRGIKTLACAGIITLVSWFMGSPVWFGILHLLGTCMLFYGLTHKLWERIPQALAPVIYIAGIIICIPLTRGIISSERYLWMLGWTYEGFLSYDYFPLLPWIFVFLLGTCLGGYIKEGRMPDRFYTMKVPALANIGRRSLVIYMLHQPVLYGVIMLAVFISQKL